MVTLSSVGEVELGLPSRRIGGDDVGLQWLLRARWRDKTQQEMLADRAGASLRGRSVGRMAGSRVAGLIVVYQSCAVRRGEAALGI